MKKLERILPFAKLLNEFRLVDRMLYANGKDRMDNDVEHSYQLAMLAWYIADLEKLPFNQEKLLKYALIHDLVEVYAGDTYIFSKDQTFIESKEEREAEAMVKLKENFPDFEDLHALIEQYEKKEDRESRFVYALDKIQPIINIYLDGGRIWKEEEITQEMLETSKKDKVALSPEIKEYFDELMLLLKENESQVFHK
jgi:putative hydrolase of HD superfamily